MEKVGIICEYNPFHNGHIYHLNKIHLHRLILLHLHHIHYFEALIHSAKTPYKYTINTINSLPYFIAVKLLNILIIPFIKLSIKKSD